MAQLSPSLFFLSFHVPNLLSPVSLLVSHVKDMCAVFTRTMINILYFLLIFLSISVCSQSDENSFQERHKLIISPKTESCFFLPNLQEGYQLSISYLVVSSKNGKQQDITMRLRDPKRMLVTYQGRRSTGNYSDYTVKAAGDFELCFNNRHSHTDSKKVVWQFDIEGD